MNGDLYTIDGMGYEQVDEFYFSINIREDMLQTIKDKNGAMNKFDDILSDIQVNTLEALQSTFNRVFGEDVIVID
jgi:hypothetical protein